MIIMTDEGVILSFLPLIIHIHTSCTFLRTAFAVRSLVKLRKISREIREVHFCGFLIEKQGGIHSEQKEEIDASKAMQYRLSKLKGKKFFSRNRFP